MKEITVVLLTRNRTNFAKQALKSLVDQDFSDFQLIISDNSDDNKFEAIVMQTCKYFANFSYVKRTSPLSSEDHFKQVLREVDSDYFVLFHDDDVARPSFISSLLSFIKNNPKIVAVACNGVVISEENLYRNGMFYSAGKIVKISTAEDLVRRYFSLDGYGCAPWPSYMYRSIVIPKILDVKQTLGKHSDFLWLVSLLNIGCIAWLPDKLIEYRVHSLSDSAHESRKDRLSILGLLKKDFPRTVNRYRFIFYIKIIANYRQNSLIKNFYLSKPSVKMFIYKQFINEFLSGSIILWLIYKVKKLIKK